MDDSGTVSGEEFLNGCLRLRGPAKGLDLALLLKEVRRIAQMQQQSLDTCIDRSDDLGYPSISTVGNCDDDAASDTSPSEASESDIAEHHVAEDHFGFQLRRKKPTN